MSAAAVLVVGAIIAIVVGIRSAEPGRGTDGAASPPASALPSTPPSPSPSVSVSDSPVEPTDGPDPSPDFGEPVAEVVSPDEEGAFGTGVTARITSITPFELAASGVGEVSGSAVRVGLEVNNGSSGRLDLTGFAVNAYYGSETAPAAPASSDPDASALKGSAGEGQIAIGSYSFAVPEDQLGSLIITVSSGAAIPLIVFAP